MLSLGTELFLAFWMASKSVGLAAGSPPPVRAATSMFLISLANILPRFASIAAFLCLVVAHLEWPLMAPRPSSRDGPSYRGPPTAGRDGTVQEHLGPDAIPSTRPPTTGITMTVPARERTHTWSDPRTLAAAAAGQDGLAFLQAMAD